MPITTPNVALTARTARTSQPPENDPKFDSQEAVDAHFGTDQPKARVAADRTRWCRRCDQTAPPGPNSAFCTAHHNERKAHTKKVRKARAASAASAAPDRAAPTPASNRAEQPPAPEGTLPIPIATLRLLASKSDVLIAAAGHASARYQRLADPSKVAWVHELMLAAKEMHLAAESTVRDLPAPGDDGS